MADGLFLPDGSFQTFSAEALTCELATRQNAGFFLGDVGGWLNTLPDPDPVLRRRGEDAAVLADLSADDQVTTAMLSRKYRVLTCQHYAFRAGAPDGQEATPEAATVYERLTRDLERTNLRNVISGILDAPFFGMTPLELIWRFEAGWWHLCDIVPRPYHWFAYDQHNQPLFRGGCGLGYATPQPLPPGKFVFATHHATYDNPYGLRLLSRCLWPVAFKRGGLQFYARFVERHGMPWVVANAPSKAEQFDKRVMVSDLARMVQDCVAVIPSGAEVKFLTAGTTQAQLHEDFLARQDKAIAKLLMGQTLTVEMEGKNNSQAAATTHQDVAEGIADSDKAMVADVLNEICWIYTQLNAGQDVFAPVFTYEEPEDLLKKAQLDKLLTELGVEWLDEHMQNDYGLKPTEYRLKSAQPEATGAGPNQDAPASFAAAPEVPESAEDAQQTLDTAIEKLLPDALHANRAFVTQVENAISAASSFDELQLALADLLSTRVGESELEACMARSMSMAAGFGATAVQEETKGQGGQRKQEGNNGVAQS